MSLLRRSIEKIAWKQAAEYREQRDELKNKLEKEHDCAAREAEILTEQRDELADALEAAQSRILICVNKLEATERWKLKEILPQIEAALQKVGRLPIRKETAYVTKDQNPAPTRVDIGHATPTSREEFEIWARERNYDLFSYASDGAYVHPCTYHAWLGWQAAWKAGAASPKDIVIRTLRAEVERLAGELDCIAASPISHNRIQADATLQAEAARALLARLDKET